MEGYVMQLQPFSVNDGDGIRTTVFMAGCPLRCQWCSNPEGQYARETVGWYSRRCIGCGRCARVCPRGIGIDLSADRSRCISCGRCVDACPAQARVRMVSCRDADDILSEITRHRLFYSMSGGGITFSGGEACMQPDLLNYLTEKIYDMGYDMAIETSGCYDHERVRPSLERMDQVFMDLKLIDDEKHIRYTGVSNKIIIDNMRRLDRLQADIIIRIPVICGVNDDDDNICRSAELVASILPGARMELLSYHSLGTVKYEALGLAYDHPEFSAPSADRMDELKGIIRSYGIGIADFR